MVWRKDHLVDGEAGGGFDRGAVLGESEPGVRRADDDEIEIVGRRARFPVEACCPGSVDEDLDSAGPIALAEFYERLLGWSIVRREGPRPGMPSTDGWAMVRSPTGDMKIELQWDPHYRPPVWPSVEGEQLMMVHLDIGVADLDAGVRWAVGQGATVADHQPQADVRVMLDPDGHPFCLFPDDSI